MPTELGHGAPQYSIKQYSGCFLEGVLDKLNTEICGMGKEDSPPYFERLPFNQVRV